MKIPSLLAIVCGVFLWMPLLGQTWETPAVELAKRTAAICGPGTATLTLRNLSVIPNDQLPAIRRALLDAFAAQGITVRDGSTDAATAIHVSLSESAQGPVWVAEVQQGPETRVAMLALPPVERVAAPANASVSLRKTLLFAAAEPMLDAQLILLPADPVGAAHLVVLFRERITVLRRAAGDAGGWSKEREFEIAHTRPFPRDLRGRLLAGGRMPFLAYLPGVICTAAQPAEVGSLSVTCSDSDDPWPVGARKAVYNASRNAFTGVLLPSMGPEVEAFYSSAELAPGRAVFSGVSGRFLLVENGAVATLSGTRDWGSDVAAVQRECGTHLLVSAAGSAAEDSLLAVEVNGHAAVAASAPVTFPGQITALWPAAQDGGQAVAIVDDVQAANYEVYGVSLVCN